ncbi:hypothetical protein [Streptomyces sp. NRRL WC-3742]|uniref:hypothetical protein n=1 Tax=Streptomyces sp. NRRL WC-3742 TaxID=1463934 RepID=UPI0004C4BC31|nr:hypothetical protein [Streptomyces sp. NRRL WC-3742]
MTTPPGDAANPILEQAQNLLASRIDPIRPLAELIVRHAEVSAELANIEKAYGAAYASAVAAGWTDKELQQMGAHTPTRRPAGRPKGSRTSRPATDKD